MFEKVYTYNLYEIHIFDLEEDVCTKGRWCTEAREVVETPPPLVVLNAKASVALLWRYELVVGG